jgi:hypothetical protein
MRLGHSASKCLQNPYIKLMSFRGNGEVPSLIDSNYVCRYQVEGCTTTTCVRNTYHDTEIVSNRYSDFRDRTAAYTGFS